MISSATSTTLRPPNFTDDYGRICFYRGRAAQSYQQQEQMRVTNPKEGSPIYRLAAAAAATPPNPLQAELCTHNVISSGQRERERERNLLFHSLPQLLLLLLPLHYSVRAANNMIH